MTDNAEVVLTDQRRYPHGVPSWVDVTPPDVATGAEFYAGMFGWVFIAAMPPEAPGACLVATLDGHDVAAITPAEGTGTPSWRTYVACDDADLTAAAVEQAGGTDLVPPQDAGPGGRTAACADPQGAVFHVWQA